jgi:hypothetical protein
MNSNTNTNAAAGQNEDYLDKGAWCTLTLHVVCWQRLGLDAAEKKWGGSMGQDTQKNRAVNEKIVSSMLHALTKTYLLTMLQQTDGARNMFEKATGKNVPDKFSN